MKRNSILYDTEMSNAKNIKEDFGKFLLNKNGTVHKFYEKNEDKNSIIREMQILVD